MEKKLCVAKLSGADLYVESMEWSISLDNNRMNAAPKNTIFLRFRNLFFPFFCDFGVNKLYEWAKDTSMKFLQHKNAYNSKAFYVKYPSARILSFRSSSSRICFQHPNIVISSQEKKNPSYPDECVFALRTQLRLSLCVLCGPEFVEKKKIALIMCRLLYFSFSDTNLGNDSMSLIVGCSVWIFHLHNWEKSN